MRLRQRRQPEPVRGEHRLVGGDDRQAARERRLDRFERDAVGSADQFDEDVDIAPEAAIAVALSKKRAPPSSRAPATPVAGAVGRDRARPPGPRGQFRRPAFAEAERGCSRPRRDRRRPGAAALPSHPRSAFRIRTPLAALRPSFGPGSTKREGRSAPPLGDGFLLLLALLAGGVAGVALELLLELELLLLFAKHAGPRPRGRAPRAAAAPAGRLLRRPCGRLRRRPPRPGAWRARPRAPRAPRESPCAWPRARPPPDRSGRTWISREISQPSPSAPWRRPPGGQRSCYHSERTSGSD